LLLQFEKLKATLEEEFVELLLKYVYKDNDLFYTKSVCELLWGYNDPVLELLKTFRLTDVTLFALEVGGSLCLYCLP